MNHQTYRQLTDDNQHARICCHQCAWEIEYDYDPETGEIVRKPGRYFPGYTRISHEGEIQAALDAGIVGPELAAIAEQHNAHHHWCINRDCNGLGDGSCGVSVRVDALGDDHVS